MLRADYALCYKPHIPLAVVEAKDNSHAVGAGMAQAIKDAGLLDVPFSFSTNGDGFVFRDATLADGVLEHSIGLAESHPLPNCGTVCLDEAGVVALLLADTAGKARAAAIRAVQVDPNRAEAHAALGMVRFYVDWDRRGAETEFQQAIKPGPSSIAARVDDATNHFSVPPVEEPLAQSAAAGWLSPARCASNPRWRAARSPN